jgi:hypothetical protein
LQIQHAYSCCLKTEFQDFASRLVPSSGQLIRPYASEGKVVCTTYVFSQQRDLRLIATVGSKPLAEFHQSRLASRREFNFERWCWARGFIAPGETVVITDSPRESSLADKADLNGNCE